MQDGGLDLFHLHVHLHYVHVLCFTCHQRDGDEKFLRSLITISGIL